MVKRNKNGQFEPGKSPNPKGRKKGTYTLPKEIKIYNSRDIAETIMIVSKMTSDEMSKVMNDPRAEGLLLLITRLWSSAIVLGDEKKAQWLIDRMCGKLKEEINHLSSDGSMSPKAINLKNLSKEELEMLLHLQTKISE